MDVDKESLQLVSDGLGRAGLNHGPCAQGQAAPLQLSQSHWGCCQPKLRGVG
jgi:hypothetical protein